MSKKSKDNTGGTDKPGLKEGAQVEVTIEADPEAMEPKKGRGRESQSAQMAKNKETPN
jgi:hypothetical protein